MPPPEGRVVCFVDPAFKGPFPVFIHNNVERKKAFLKKKADNAREREPSAAFAMGWFPSGVLVAAAANLKREGDSKGRPRRRQSEREK